MGFRLVPNSVTLDDLERRNSANRRVISPNSVGFGADYVLSLIHISEPTRQAESTGVSSTTFT